MPQIPQITANEQGAALNLPTPTAEHYGASGFAQVAQAGAAFDTNYQRLQHLQYKALAHAQGLLAVEDYSRETALQTEAIYAANPTSPTVAMQQTETMMKETRARVVSQYGGTDAAIASAIDGHIAAYNTTNFPKLIERTATATQNMVDKTVLQAAQTAAQTAIFGSEADAEYRMTQLAETLAGFRGNGLSDAQIAKITEDIAQQVSVNGAEHEIKQMPTRVGARLMGIQLTDPSLRGMTREKALATRKGIWELNKDALQARSTLKGDVIDADFVMALQRNAIGPEEFQKLMDTRGKPKELTMMFLIQGGQLAIKDIPDYVLRNGIDDPAVVARAYSTSYMLLDRAAAEDEKQRKEKERADKVLGEMEEFAIRDTYLRKENPYTSQEVSDEVMRLVSRGRMTGERAAQLVKEARDIERKVGPDNVRAYNEWSAMIHADPTRVNDPEILRDPELNDMRTRELIALRGRLIQERKKADHFTNQPLWKDVESQLRLDYQITGMTVPTSQAASGMKRFYDLTDPAQGFKMQPWAAYKQVLQEVEPILPHEPVKALDNRINNLMTLYERGQYDEAEVKKWLKDRGIKGEELRKAFELFNAARDRRSRKEMKD